MPDTLFFLLLGHVFGDFALQTDRMAREKAANKGILSMHVLIYVVTIAAFWWLGKRLNGGMPFVSVTTALVLAALYVQHWLQDSLKATRFNGSKQAFFLDQAAHLTVLYIMRLAF